MNHKTTPLGKLILFIVCLYMFSGALSAFGKDYSQREVIAMTILGEARGEGERGMYAVATIISQRMKNRALTGKKVCLEPWQFSCWNKNDPNRAKLPILLRNSPQRHYALRLADNISRLDRSYTKNADHYIHKNSKKPKHLRGKKPVIVIGAHAFYKLR